MPCPYCHVPDEDGHHEHRTCEECGNLFRWNPERATKEFEKLFGDDPEAMDDEKVSVCTTCHQSFMRWFEADEKDQPAIQEEELKLLNERRRANGWPRRIRS